MQEENVGLKVAHLGEKKAYAYWDQPCERHHNISDGKWPPGEFMISGANFCNDHEGTEHDVRKITVYKIIVEAFPGIAKKEFWNVSIR